MNQTQFYRYEGQIVAQVLGSEFRLPLRVVYMVERAGAHHVDDVDRVTSDDITLVRVQVTDDVDGDGYSVDEIDVPGWSENLSFRERMADQVAAHHSTVIGANDPDEARRLLVFEDPEDMDLDAEVIAAGLV